MSLFTHWDHHIFVEWCLGFDQHNLSGSQVVLVSQGKKNNTTKEHECGSFEGKSRFLQVSN